MINRRALLICSFIFFILAANPWSQAVASSYLGQFCLVMTVDAVVDGQPAEIKEGVLRIGMDNMRDNHITVSGTLEIPNDARPVGGNAELINNIWRMSLLSTWALGNDIYHMNLIPETLEGSFSRMRQIFDPELNVITPSYATGNIIGFSCPVIIPGSICDHLNISPGHLPPPGLCKIWNPELPEGHQGPPGACDAFIGHIPLGACLIDHYGVVRGIGG